MAHAQRAHAILAPSGAERWFNCTASVPLIEKEQPPNRSSADAEEGTAAHELLEACLKKQKAPTHKSWLGKVFNKWPVTQEMAEAVQVAYDFALELELDGWTIYSEQKNPIACTGEGGTTDIAAVKKNRLKIADYKHGKGVIVDAAENMQMRLYALGMIDKLKIRDTVEEVELIIIQPRAQQAPVRWMDTVADLFKFEKQVAKKREDISNGVVSFVPTEKGCRWCPVRMKCKAFMQAGAEAAKMDFAGIVDGDHKPFKMLSNEELNAAALNMSFIKTWIKTLNEAIFAAASAGKLEDFKVVLGSADRRWKDESAVATALHKMKFDEDDYRPRSLLGLGAIGKLIKDKEKREEFMNKYTMRPEGKPALVSSEDPRPAINPADDFAGITDQE